MGGLSKRTRGPAVRTAVRTADFLDFEFFILGSGVVPLDSDRNAVQNPGIFTSGALISIGFVTKR